MLVTNTQGYNVPLLSPSGSTVLLTTVSAQLIGQNFGRRGIIFTNPGANRLFICPANIVAVIGQGLPLVAGGVITLMGDGKLINYTCGWNGIAETGVGNPIGIMELL